MKINKKKTCCWCSCCPFFKSLYLCIESTSDGREQRYEYVYLMSMGNKKLKKQRHKTPEQVSKKEDIQAEQIVVKITDQGYVTSHGDHFHYYNGKVPFDAIFSEELLMKDANYQ